MRYQILFLFVITIFLISCGGEPTKPSQSNTTATNSTVTNNSNSNSPLGTTNTPEPPKISEAVSIAPTVQGYYDALKKKDEAGAKKFLSTAALKYYEDEAKSEKKTWFAFVLEENDPVDDKREVRNEKIEGDNAVAEIKGGSLGTWTKVGFIKEGGEWKFASPDIIFQKSDIKRTEALPKPTK